MAIKFLFPSLQNFFLKNLKKYILFFVVPFFLCCCITLLSYQNLRKYSLQINQLQLSENVDASNDIFSSMIFTSQFLYQHADFSTLTGVSSQLPPDQILTLRNANDLMRQLSSVQGNVPYYFSLFAQNNVFVSSIHSSRDFMTYYPEFLSIVHNGKTLSAMEVKEILFSYSNQVKPLAFCTTDSTSIFANGTTVNIDDAILCIVNGNGSEMSPSYITVFLLNPTDFVSSILPANLVDYASVCVTDKATGTMLMKYTPSATADTFHTFEYEIDNYLSISVGIPISIIAKPMQSILTLLGLFLAATLFFSMISTAILSYQEANRLKSLFAVLPQTSSYTGSSKDEYHLLQQIISKVSNDVDEYTNQLNLLKAQNKSSQMETLIIRGVNTPEETQAFEQFFPTHNNAFCVALLRTYITDESNSATNNLMINEYFNNIYPNQFVCVPTTLKENIYLFSLSSESIFSPDQLVQDFYKIIYTLSDNKDTFFNVAISSVCCSISDLRLCYNQAHQTMLLHNSPEQNVVEKYDIKMPSPHENIVDIDFMNHLYHLLLSASRTAIQEQFSQIIQIYRTNPKLYDSQRQQIFYAIRNVLLNAKLNISPSIAEKIPLPHYTSSILPQILQSLEETCLLFCDCVEASKHSHNSERKNQILEYIQIHYTSVTFSPSVVCAEFGISDKYLFHFFRDQVNTTFSDYVEKLRIKKAKEYLSQTAYSNEQIASLIGFGSTTTFYRAFNRQTGISPGAYKTSHRSQ